MSFDISSFQIFQPRTNQYFDQVDKIINQKKVSSRIIFMLQDLKDLRRSNWVARRILDAPKTIDEIHEEAKQEEIQMQMAHQQAAQKRLMNKGSVHSDTSNPSTFLTFVYSLRFLTTNNHGSQKASGIGMALFVTLLPKFADLLLIFYLFPFKIPALIAYHFVWPTFSSVSGILE